jgi:allantoinase
VWRILRLFAERELPLTVFATGQALERNPALARHLAATEHEVCGHGWRWIDYASVPRDQEREDIRRTVAAFESLVGRRPVGWYTGRRSVHTRDLLIEEGGFLYDSDSYADDLPYFVEVAGRPHLVLPYSLDCNDFRFATSPGFSSSRDFSAHLQDAFDLLHEEGARAPKMMSVGLHGRIGGRPARAAALARFVDHARAHDGVWICRREDIARHVLGTWRRP